MNRFTRIRTATLGTAIAAALVMGAAGAATAESVTIADPADTSGSLSDIREVTAKHTSTKVVVKVGFTELEPASDGGPSSLSVFVDTDRTAKGPEFRLGAGLQEGADFQLVRVKSWKVVGEPLSCSHSIKLDFEANTARAKLARACLGGPDEVRVGVKMTDAYDGSHVLVDWLKKPRGFTTWLVAA